MRKVLKFKNWKKGRQKTKQKSPLQALAVRSDYYLTGLDSLL